MQALRGNKPEVGAASVMATMEVEAEVESESSICNGGNVEVEVEVGSGGSICIYSTMEVGRSVHASLSCMRPHLKQPQKRLKWRN